jgi:hypothetical protein
MHFLLQVAFFLTKWPCPKSLKILGLTLYMHICKYNSSLQSYITLTYDHSGMYTALLGQYWSPGEYYSGPHKLHTPPLTFLDL